MVDGKLSLLRRNKESTTKTLTFRPKSKGGKKAELEVNELLMAEIGDQYKLFSMLLHYFHEPSLFVNLGRYDMPWGGATSCLPL